jgi:tetratricopeptide (TPR) repeat protein
MLGQAAPPAQPKAQPPNQGLPPGLPAAKSAPGPLETAMAHLAAGRFSAAEPILVKLYKSTPNDPRINQALAYLYNLKGDHTRALPLWQKAVRIQPTPQAYNGLAATLGELGRNPEAEANFLKALRLEPNNLGTSFNLAGLYMKRNDFGAAAPLLEKVVKGAPGQPQPAYMLALCYSATGHADQAQNTLLALPAKARDIEEIQLMLGAIAREQNKPAEARKYFERVLQLNPDSVTGAASLGALLAAGDEPARGVTLLEDAWKRDKTSYVAGYNLALAYKRAGKLAESRSVLASLLTKGETPEIYNLLGSVEVGLNNSKDALGYLERAVEMDPRETYFFDLGYQQLQNHFAPEAAATFQKGTQRHPDAVRLWLGLGTAYLALSRNDDAMAAYQKAAGKGEDAKVQQFLETAKRPGPSSVDELIKSLK